MEEKTTQNQLCNANGDISDSHEQDVAPGVCLSRKTGSRAMRCMVESCSLLMYVVDSRLTSTLMELLTTQRNSS